MNITLPRARQEWLEAQGRAGAYDSVGDAVATILWQPMNLAIDDMAWANSPVARIDETLEKLERR